MNNIRFYRPQITGPQRSVQHIDHVPTNRVDLAEVIETTCDSESHEASLLETTAWEREVDKAPRSRAPSQPKVEASKTKSPNGQFQRYI